MNDYTVDILQSQAPSNVIADYDIIKKNLAADSYSYDDISVQGLQHGTRKWYYKIKVTNTDTGDIEYYPSDGYAYLNDEIPNYR